MDDPLQDWDAVMLEEYLAEVGGAEPAEDERALGVRRRVMDELVISLRRGRAVVDLRPRS